MRDNNVLAAQRRAAADGIVIDNPRARLVRECVMYQIEHARGATIRHTLGSLLIGLPQSGKSTILQSIANELNQRAEPGKRLPAVYVTLDQGVTRKQLAQNILEVLEDFGVHTLPYEKRIDGKTEIELLRRVRLLLSGLHTEVLILDEFHHIRNSDNKKVAYSVGETIKRMLTYRMFPIVMAGLEDARLPYDENDQLAKRCREPIVLKKLSALEAEDLELFIGFLEDYLTVLEQKNIIKHALDLCEGDVPAGILLATDGVLGDACNFIKHAVDEATWGGRDRIARVDLSNVARKHYGRADNLFQGSEPVGIRETRSAKCAT